MTPAERYQRELDLPATFYALASWNDPKRWHRVQRRPAGSVAPWRGHCGKLVMFSTFTKTPAGEMCRGCAGLRAAREKE